MSQPDPNTSEKRLMQEIEQLARQRMQAVPLGDADLELLAAYSDGNVDEADKIRCERILASNPNALDLVEELHGLAETGKTDLSAPDLPDLSVVSPDRGPSPTWSRWYVPPSRLVLAASLVVTISSLICVIWVTKGNRDAKQQIVALQQSLADATRRHALSEKQRVLELTPSPIRHYWSGEVTPEILKLEPEYVRGTASPPPAAQASAAVAERVLKRLGQLPGESGRTTLESAALSIAMGRLNDADRYLRQAAELIGEQPEVSNLRAVWYIAQGETDKAERLLREATQRHPDFTPAWYNLALVLTEYGDRKESRDAWQRFLALETRPPYRQAAERHLAAINP